jgi:flagellar hook-basal body complex protein FliE
MMSIEAIRHPLGTTGPEFARGTKSPASVGFANALAELAQGTIDATRAAEAVSLATVTGEMSVQQVAASIMAAEQSLQTAIAIRDKVVAAYLEIQRMPI